MRTRTLKIATWNVNGIRARSAELLALVGLERAARKLRMGAVDITEVALAAGYDTHAAFGKAFKQQFGLSPSEFRQLGCWAATQLLRKG